MFYQHNLHQLLINLNNKIYLAADDDDDDVI